MIDPSKVRRSQTRSLSAWIDAEVSDQGVVPLFVGFEGTPGEANAWRQPGTARERVSELERREEDLLGRAVFDRGIERAVEEGCVRVKEDAHGQEWRAHSTRMERNDSCISRQIVRPPMRAWAYVSVHCYVWKPE